MRKAWCVAAMLALSATPGLAADPAGNWLVADKTAVIRIAPCAQAYCGTIAWTAQPGTDEHNSDPSKRDHPDRGHADPARDEAGQRGGGNRWDGQIYNPENGK